MDAHGIESLDILIALAILGITMYSVYAWRLSRRRETLMKAPFPPEYEDYLRRNVGVYSRLPDELRRKLKGMVNIFLAEKEFEACGGLDISDEIRVTIAAQACVLILNRPNNFFPKLSCVLVYPSAYIAKARTDMGGGGAIEDSPSARLGESWVRGSLVVAWDHARRDGGNPHDGHNVIFHEFAHQLDQEDGCSNGIPPLDSGELCHKWSRVFSEDYQLLRRKVKKHIRDVMDDYGATNPAEFFAVATESFFEKSDALRERHPELYDCLKSYYNLDPASWS